MSGLLLRLSILCGLLAMFGWGGFALWREAVRTPLPAIAAQQPSDTQPTTHVAPASKPPLSAFSETLKRPLFFEGRTYPEPLPTRANVSATPSLGTVRLPAKSVPTTLPATLPTPASTDGLKLLGILVNQGQSRALIEALPQTGEWLGIGAKIRDWTIESISADRVALRQGRQTTTLELYNLSPTYPRPSTR